MKPVVFLGRIGALAALVTLASGLAAAQDEGAGLGLGAGAVRPDVGSESLRSTAWFTGNLRLKVSRYVAVEPEAGYWKRTETVAGVELSLEDLNFGGSALIIIPADRVEIWGGAGGGGHRLKGTLAPGLGLSASESRTKFGWHLLGGIDIKLSDHAAVFGAGRYDRIKGDAAQDERDLDLTKLYGGLRLIL